MDGHHFGSTIFCEILCTVAKKLKNFPQNSMIKNNKISLDLKKSNKYFVIYIKKLIIGFFFFSNLGEYYIFSISISSSYSIYQYSLFLVRFPFNISYKDIMFNFNIKDILLDIIFVKYPRLPNNQNK